LRTLPSEEAAAYRACTDAAGRARQRERLAGAIRALLQRRVATRLAGATISEDLLEHELVRVTLSLLAQVIDAELVPGEEDAYVRAAARNVAATALRRTRRGPDVDRGASPDELPAPDAWEQSAAIVQRELEQTLVRELAAAAPDNYRVVLQEHYLGGTPLAELALQEHGRRLAAGQETVDDEGARRRAQDVIHQRAHRARQWLKLAMAKRLQAAEADP
jgi:DNA-directed RNA polymerase specialized sigma24 family protein